MNREYTYLVTVEDENSQAGSYAGGGTDGGAVKAGKGVKGRMTGGTVVAKSEKDAKDKIQELFKMKVTMPVTNEDGTFTFDSSGKIMFESRVVDQKIHFLDISPRGVIISPDEVSL